MKKTILAVLMLILIPVSAVAQDYVIGVEDVLDIRVWGSPDLSVVVPVRPDGKVTVPLVGDIQAAGLTTSDLKKELENRLVEFVKNPVVTVIVQAVNSFKVYVVGGVKTGVIDLKRKTTLMELLAMIGSLENADLKGAFILRGGEKLQVDFHALAVKGDVTQNIEILPGDIIFIPDNFDKRIQIIGAVKNPSTISYRDGLTLLDAILLAGGLTEFANPNKILVVRNNGGESKTIEVKFKEVIEKGDATQNIALEPGDLVIVKEGLFPLKWQ